jgi:hypothetical protein
MADDYDDEKPWTRQLFVVIGVLVAVALVIGAILSVIALGAAKVTGIDSAKSTASAKPSLYVPSGKPTVGLEPVPEPSGVPDRPKKSPTGSQSSGSSGSDGSDSPDSPGHEKNGITLQLYPQQVSAGQRINISGVYTNGEGAQLQVQRFENGSWSDFPVTTSVSGGQFATYITTSHTGPQRFRVTDKAADRESNAVRVRVG